MQSERDWWVAKVWGVWSGEAPVRLSGGFVGVAPVYANASDADGIGESPWHVYSRVGSGQVGEALCRREHGKIATCYLTSRRT